MTASVRLMVCIPAFSIRRCIKVNPAMTIQALKENYLPDPDCDLIFEGLILHGKMTVTFYSLTDGTTLFAVDRRADSAQLWTRIASDMDEFRERQRLRSDPRLAGEHARLRDLQFARLLDRRPAAAAPARLLDDLEAPRAARCATVVPDARPAKPAVLPLPVCWRPRDGEAGRSVG